MFDGIVDAIRLYLAKLPGLLFALLVLLIGWLIVKMVSRSIRNMLEKTRWDNKLFEYMGVPKKYNSHEVISKVVYYALMVFVFILVFNLLNLHVVAQPLVDMMSQFVKAVPNLLKALLLAVVAWIIASLGSMWLSKAGQMERVRDSFLKMRVAETEEEYSKSVHTASRILFYLILIIFLPGILGALNIQSIAAPISDMLTQFLEFLPKLFGAALTLLIGWLIARVVRKIVTGFLQTVGLDQLIERFGLSKLFGNSAASVVGTIAFVLILIPTVIAALQTLDLEGISVPAIAMLTNVLAMIPSIIIGVILVVIGVWLGDKIGDVVSDLLEKVGFNSVVKYLGLGSWNPENAQFTLSQVVGRITQIAIILVFVVQALHVVHLDSLVAIVMAFIAYLPHLLTALAIVAVGIILGNVVHRILLGITSGTIRHLSLLGSIAKYTIIVLAVFMAFDQLGIASTIVSSAFILILGGLALAFGLAFGLGGREHASAWIEKWKNS